LSLDELEKLLAGMAALPWEHDDGVIHARGQTIADTCVGNGEAIVAIVNAAPELLAVARAAEPIANNDGGDTYDDWSSLRDALYALERKLAGAPEGEP
jgi:hypothetical protein